MIKIICYQLLTHQLCVMTYIHHTFEAGISLPILQRRKLRSREVKENLD